MDKALGQIIARIPSRERGFDSSYPLPWLYPGGPDEFETIEAVQTLLRNISEVSGFGAAQLASGALVEDETDVRAMERAADEIGNTLEVLRRALWELRREVTTDQRETN